VEETIRSPPRCECLLILRQRERLLYSEEPFPLPYCSGIERRNDMP
jgi:hypothetical protein